MILNHTLVSDTHDYSRSGGSKSYVLLLLQASVTVNEMYTVIYSLLVIFKPLRCYKYTLNTNNNK